MADDATVLKPPSASPIQGGTVPSPTPFDRPYGAGPVNVVIVKGKAWYI